MRTQHTMPHQVAKTCYSGTKIIGAQGNNLFSRPAFPDADFGRRDDRCNGAAATSDTSHTPVQSRKGLVVHAVLGVSLKSNDVAWVLLHSADGTVLDYDALESPADARIAGVAARSALSIAQAGGFEVDRVRLTWADDMAKPGLQLRLRLRNLGVGQIETVPVQLATAAAAAPAAAAIRPRVAWAYGAARAVVPASAQTDPGAPHTAPSAPQIPVPSRNPRGRVLSAAIGAAAVAVLGLLSLSAGAAPQPDPPAPMAERPEVSDAGWATVPSPSDAATTSVRKVVAAPSRSQQQVTAAPVQTNAPARVVAAAAPEPAPAGPPHLTGASPAAGPVSGLADPAAAPAPGPDMDEVMKALSALP